MAPRSGAKEAELKRFVAPFIQSDDPAYDTNVSAELSASLIRFVNTVQSKKNTHSSGTLREDVSGTFNLPPDEAKHAVKSLRLSEGAAVSVFDPLFQIEIRGRLTSHSVIEVSEMRTTWRPLPTLLLGRPETKIVEFLIEKATEIGVKDIVLFEADRSQGQADAKRLPRLNRIRDAALKQSFACHAPSLQIYSSLEEMLISLEASGTHTPCAAAPLFTALSPNAKSTLEQSLNDFSLSSSVDPNMRLLIGPEGGLTDREHSLAHEHLSQWIMLSPHTLRVETAVIAGLILPHVTSLLPAV